MIAVVGDILVDRWVYGSFTKISGEGTPVFKVEKTVESPGGAANVAANIRALGADCELFGHRPNPPVKTRYAGTYLRVDEEDVTDIPQAIAEQIVAKVKALGPNIIVISDYAKGIATPWLCQALIGLGVTTIVDPKGEDWRKYDGAAIVCPNEAEFAACRVNAHGLSAILYTQGASGMTLQEANKPEMHIPAHTQEVFDVAGAGDTVVAALAYALSLGYPLSSAARIANAAAGVVVAKRGTATCSREELEEVLENGGTVERLLSTSARRTHSLAD